MTSKITFVLLILSSLITYAQTLKGTVLDAKTKQPLETVSVYFDNTTIGTTTNAKGEFSIDYTDAVQSTLVISFLGYDKQYISNFRDKTTVIIELNEAAEQLDEVVIDADDGMSRAVKLRWFRKEFLGQSVYGKSCKILNEKDLRFRYNKKTNTLIAWSNTPVLVRNKSLKYDISFDIIEFELVIGNWSSASVTYSGTTFFKDIDTKGKKKTSKNRAEAYRGSVQHFMRALYNKKFKEEGYIFGVKGFKVDPFKFFKISNADENNIKTITLIDKLDIFYEDASESVIQTSETNIFRVDEFGNYEEIPNVLFGGDMGNQRVGDLLPLNYKFTKNK